MDLDRLQGFLLWSLLVNAGIYIISLVGVLSLRRFMCKIHAKLFGVSELRDGMQVRGAPHASCLSLDAMMP